MQKEYSNSLAVAHFSQRNIMRITEQIYDRYYKNTNYSFWLLSLQLHDFSKFCETLGIDSIDLQERAIVALYRQHFNAHSVSTLQYVLAMLRNASSTPESRVRAIEKMIENQ